MFSDWSDWLEEITTVSSPINNDADEDPAKKDDESEREDAKNEDAPVAAAEVRPPAGVSVCLEAHQAKNLTNMRASSTFSALSGNAEMDPYCLVRLLPSKRSTARTKWAPAGGGVIIVPINDALLRIFCLQ